MTPGKAAHVLAARLLDLDNLSARLGQHKGGERPRQQGREVENGQTFERKGHGAPIQFRCIAWPHPACLRTLKKGHRMEPSALDGPDPFRLSRAPPFGDMR